MSLARFRRERKSAVAVLFACMALPIVGLLGIAIDFGLWNQTSASLSLAASGAALNAVKIAATGQLAADPNYLAEGTSAGTQWFEVQAAHNAGNLVNVVPTVSVTGTTSITSSVTYAGTIKSIFGSLFAVTHYPINVAASATITTAPYLNIEILLDNSSSMEIGATPTDIEAMQDVTTCSPEGEWKVTALAATEGTADQQFSAYNYDHYDQADGVVVAPLVGAYLPFPYTLLNNNTLVESSANYGPSCTTKGATTGTMAGAPCAFACHWDITKSAGLGPDYFYRARLTLAKTTKCFNNGTPGNCAITLRFDLVKQAVNDVISQMQQDDLAINNLNVGIFTLPGLTGGIGPLAYVTPVYPGCVTPPYNSVACQAGGNWATATGDVGATPTGANQAEPGIQPALWANACCVNGGTDFTDAMSALSSQMLTASGDGTSAATPVKVLFLVTDGVEDYTSGTRTLNALNPASCTAFKNLGYTIYVVYTPYYPLMNNYYAANIKSFAEPMATSTLAANLQACSSGAGQSVAANQYYIEANPTDAGSINSALQTFLKRALAESPARFTL